MGQLEEAFRDAAGEVAQIKSRPSNRYWWLYGTTKGKNANGTLDVAIDGVTIQQVKATVSCMTASVGDRVIVLKAGPLMTCVDVIATSDRVSIPATSPTGKAPEGNLPIGTNTSKGILQVGSGLKVADDGTLSVNDGVYVKLYSEGDYGYCAYRRCGCLVSVVCDFVSTEAKTTKHLGTLPVGCRPAMSVLGMAYPRETNSSGQITVDTDGNVNVYTLEGSSGYVGGSVTFPLP